MTTVLSGQHTTLPVYGGAYPCLYFGHYAWLTPSEWQVKTLRAAACPPAAFHQAARQTRPLAGGQFAPTTNFLYVLWEIKAPEEMLTILWS
jgi:hypothetical protein